MAITAQSHGSRIKDTETSMSIADQASRAVALDRGAAGASSAAFASPHALSAAISRRAGTPGNEQQCGCDTLRRTSRWGFLAPRAHVRPWFGELSGSVRLGQ